MSVLKQASEASSTHEFDLVLDAVAQQVPFELQRFVKPGEVMKFIRTTGIVPSFVSDHCVKVIVTNKQPALL